MAKPGTKSSIKPVLANVFLRGWYPQSLVQGTDGVARPAAH